MKSQGDNSMPMLSVIVPVYNVEDYVGECLDSILDQDFKDIEVIVVDDGSTDNSADIVRQYADKDIRVKAYFKNNGGLSDTRNFALDRISGKFVTFIDSDDVLLNKDVFSKTLALFIQHRQVDIVQYNVIFKWKSSEAYVRHYPIREYITSEEILRGYLNQQIHVSCCDKIFKSEVFKNIRFPKGEISEDIAIIPQIVNTIKGIYVSCIGDYGYRHRENSITTGVPKLEKIYSVLRSYYKFLNFSYAFDDIKSIVIDSYTNLIWSYSSVIRQNYEPNLNDYYSQPIYLDISFKDWLVCSTKTIKSFLVCVCGPKWVCRFQNIFTRKQ